MPKVLRILNRTNIGGPVLNATLLTHFLAPEFETMLLAGYPTSDEKNASALLEKFGIEPIYIPEMGRELNVRADYAAFKKIKQIIADFKPDIVHTHAAKPGAIGRLAAAASGVPIILHTFHGHAFHSYFSKAKTQFYIEIEKYLARRSSRIITISPLQKKELGEVFKIAPLNKIEIIPLGLYLLPYQSNQDEKRKKFRTEFDIPDECLVISIIGRLAAVKNLSLFVKAVSYVQHNSAKPFKAFIVGDGECRTGTEDLCRILGLSISTPENQNVSADVVFTSWRTDIDVINAGSDIIAISSLNEGTPVSIIEAQASGKAVVATNCGGMLDVVLAGETALVSELGDENGFCRNLHSLVDNDALRTTLSIKGPEWAKMKYGHQRLIDDVSVLYRKLLAEKGL